MLILVTGAANSGKSEWAEYLASQSQQPVLYIATAQKIPEDKEWSRKIEKHRQRRPKDWQTLEITHEISNALQNAPPQTCVLIDSLGNWVANHLEIQEENWERIVKDFLTTLRRRRGETILVAEETGWGVIPFYPTGRIFRSRLGELIQQVGKLANTVYLTVGGYAVDITKIGLRLPSQWR
ncbi:MAG: bifunctional adenosylcobinamide kinase/adenosylcobinamide-phosphate guanylyltransferase [Geminocystis sp.]|nr:bifunctional adenosylcobinamide kinase/adenosylcobinamide-phosphate guanylyltransferase [Geminocystis sp.]